MSAGPPGRRSALGGGSESAPESLGDDSMIAASDVLPLKHNLTAIYVRDDDDVLSVALRKMRRRRPLNGAHLAAYEAWLAEQRQEAAS